jgi:DNA recombination protein RmuC
MEIIYTLLLCALVAAVLSVYFIGKMKALTAQRDVQAALARKAEQQIEDERKAHEATLAKEAEREQQLRAELKAGYEQQLQTLRRTNQEQLEAQMHLIKEQMQTTSENILKQRQEELKAENREQVSHLIDPLKESLKQMNRALEESKEKHQEAMTRLDATIQANMKRSEDLTLSADRLAKALTGEVKVQGNFGELKLKQLLERLNLKEGLQYSSQETLRDRLGNAIKDDEGRGLIPDFILHFPNQRDVIVDSKMSFTAYERYVNSDSPEEQARALKEHIASVRAQVDRLSKKDYSRYLPKGVNKLNFVIMYMHTEGALSLALMNDGTLWQEAYEKNVLILGPQTMYMNLRILEMMWIQVRQLNNQEQMMKAANLIVERTQDFCQRFDDVEKKMNDTVNSMGRLRITVAEGGPSIVTAAKSLLRAGAQENRKKASLLDGSEGLFLDNEEEKQQAN